MTLDRRFLLQSFAAAGAAAVAGARARFAFAATPSDRRLVIVILRGGLDGLAAAPPHGDKDYAAVRGPLALHTSGTGALHDLDGFFGLHPSFANLKTLYDHNQLVLFHNICSPYRGHSHLEGQNVLESGSAKPHLFQDGWLNRALLPMGIGNGDRALAIAETSPLMLSGQTPTGSWMPVMPAPDACDELTPLFQGAGKLLATSDGPRVATLEASGWDTHVAEGAADGQLARRLQALDGAIDALRAAMGPAVWAKTAVVMATEFGRTVHPNGSGGTDHGMGGAAFLFGGAVNGGQVKAEWMGLNPAVLQDGRDQPARSDLRGLFKGVLSEHMDVPAGALESVVFPDSTSAVPIRGLIRA
jgi:uncharacterized protein (DUF1501 family)